MTDEVIKFKALGEMAQRSRVGGANYVLLADLDRVTAERDAALGREAELREERNELSLQVERLKADNVNFDRLLCRSGNQRDALQQRLTAADERADLLEGLLRLWMSPVQRTMAGRCRLVERTDAALKQAEGQHNQCDGCRAGIPIVNGAHRMGKPGAYPDTMGCTAKLYKP